MEYVFVAFLIIVMALCIASGFVRNNGNGERYTKIKSKGGRKHIFDTEANDWVLWSDVLKKLEEVDRDYIESQFQYCNDTGSTSVEIDCGQARYLSGEQN